jgi:hypothetical protein
VRFTTGCKGPAKQRENEYNKYSVRNIFNFNKLGIIFLIISGLFATCETKPENGYYLIEVDSISVPNDLFAGVPFEISFYGIISYNGCSRFSHFNQAQVGDEIIQEAWKEVDLQAIVCPTVMVYLNGQKLDYTVNLPGDYLIKIRQPNYTFMEKQIVIE